MKASPAITKLIEVEHYNCNTGWECVGGKWIVREVRYETLNESLSSIPFSQCVDIDSVSFKCIGMRGLHHAHEVGLPHKRALVPDGLGQVHRLLRSNIILGVHVNDRGRVTGNAS